MDEAATGQGGDDVYNQLAELIKESQVLKEVAKELNLGSNVDEFLDNFSDNLKSIENGTRRVDFVKAGFVLATSSNIYCKEVDLWEKNAYHLGELLVGAKEKQARTKKGVEDTLGEEERENFLLLDDVIQTSNSIHIKDQFDDTADEDKHLRGKVPFALVASRPNGGTTVGGMFHMIRCDVDSSGAFLLSNTRGEDRLENIEYAPASSALIFEEKPEAGDDQGFDREDGGYESPIEPHEGGYDDFFDNQVEDDDEEEEEETDLWGERLDIHETGNGSQYRPIKRGKTCKIPSNLKNKRWKHSDGKICYNDLLVSIVLMPKIRLPAKTDSPVYPEFRQFVLEARRQERKLRHCLEREESEDTGAQQEDDYDDSNDAGFDDFHGDFHDSEHEDGDDMEGDDHAEETRSNLLRSMLGDGGDDEETTVGSIQLDKFEKSPESYVDMVKNHLLKYLETANQWASETGLHARVRKWEDKIEPILDDQTARPAFDIHEYGSRILCGLENVHEDDSEEDEDTAHTFEELGQSLLKIGLHSEAQTPEEHEYHDNRPLDQFEVCRIFLASLQLANNGNLELIHETNDSELRLKPIHNVLANERLVDYRAPSVQVQNCTDAETGHPDKVKKRRIQNENAPLNL
mmetsp:Transcript_17271/g.29558  ORF Transcript_17271/g.29558 Transcript_17271/m.29558 type:complete len:632 (-) Transcript_17271:1639-3534(-)